MSIRNYLLVLSFSVCFLATAQAQRKGNLPKMKLIPVGSFVMGGGYQFESNGASMVYLGQDPAYDQRNQNQTTIGEVPLPNNPQRKVKISPFYMSPQEVSNYQYRDFLIESLFVGAEKEALREELTSVNLSDKEAVKSAWQTLLDRANKADLLPNLTCWTDDFPEAYNKPMDDNYFTHPAFNNYPVVGVTYAQAQAYCKWLTEVNNTLRSQKGQSPQPAFRLPTEAEWEYAALGLEEASIEAPEDRKQLYPWEGRRIFDKKGQFRANIRVEPNDYVQDNYSYAAPVTSFAPNGHGLYNMAGNVAEWTSDVFRLNQFSEESSVLVDPKVVKSDDGDQYRVVKGGSWADLKYAAQVGSRCRVPENSGTSRVGFRVVQTLTPVK